MDLHGIASPYVGAVNPLIPVALRVSTGNEVDENFIPRPSYATPGSLVGSISPGVPSLLTASAPATGLLMAGQTLSGAGVIPGTQIAYQDSGDEGGAGVYVLDRPYASAVGPVAMTTSYVVMAQVQPMSWRDLQMVEGLNLNGTRRKIYLRGVTESVVRSLRKGGDLIDIVGGVNAGVWLVAQVLEQFPDWASAAITLQDET